jgi:hypothetical protein
MTQKPTGGPAFPSDYQRGMTLREYAAIKLRVPDSGTDWLDDMIREARRMDYAGQALVGFLASWQVNTWSDVSTKCNEAADAMLAAREASK